MTAKPCQARTESFRKAISAPGLEAAEFARQTGPPRSNLSRAIGRVRPRLREAAEAAAKAAKLARHRRRAAALAALGPSLTPSDVIGQLPLVGTEEGPGDSDLDHPFVIFDQDSAR